MTEKKNKPFYDDKDYRREYKLRETDLIGIYTPADQQHPAYSAPPPDYENAFSRDMTSQYLKYHCEYYFACQNYMLLASDSRRLEYAGPQKAPPRQKNRMQKSFPHYRRNPPTA